MQPWPPRISRSASAGFASGASTQIRTSAMTLVIFACSRSGARVSNVIVPPKNIGRPGSSAAEDAGFWAGEEMSVEELKERLEPFLPKGDL